jgi:hypothetical protein
MRKWRVFPNGWRVSLNRGAQKPTGDAHAVQRDNDDINAATDDSIDDTVYLSGFVAYVDLSDPERLADCDVGQLDGDKTVEYLLFRRQRQHSNRHYMVQLGYTIGEGQWQLGI